MDTLPSQQRKPIWIRCEKIPIYFCTHAVEGIGDKYELFSPYLLRWFYLNILGD